MTQDAAFFQFIAWTLVLLLAVAAVIAEEGKKSPPLPKRTIEPPDDFRW